jgi:hypothetical protein
MDVAAINPLPFTVSVVAAAPAATVVGLMDVTAGVGVVVPPPLPLEPDEPPLQAVNDTKVKLLTKRARK